MAHPKPDFTIKWGVNDEPIAPIADLDQNEGWSFLGNTPPTAAQFDYMMALYDKRDAWLEEQLPSGGTTSFIRTLLDDSDAISARQTLGLGSVVQTTGSSTSDIMSQNAISNQLIGVGQTWQDVTGSRVVNTTYTNTTGRTIIAFVKGNSSADMVLEVDSIEFDWQVSNGSSGAGQIIIPPGSTYRATASFSKWLELR